MSYPYPKKIEVHNFADMASAPNAAEWFAEHGSAPFWVGGTQYVSNGTSISAIGGGSEIVADPSAAGGIRASIISAAMRLKANGGTIIIPPGEHLVYDLPVWPGLVYAGVSRGNSLYTSSGVVNGSVLKLDTSQGLHMFAAKTVANDPDFGLTTNKLAGFDIKNLVLRGDQNKLTATLDCINMDGLAALTNAEIQQCVFEFVSISGFRCGYRNNTALNQCRDRSPTFIGCEIWDNFAGIWTNEHPRFTGRNDIRSNIYGITGKPYDVEINGQAILYNDVGISGFGSDLFGRCLISNSFLLYNVRTLANVGVENLISGNAFAPDTGTTSFSAIELNTNSRNNIINANYFDNDSSRSYSDAAILLLNTAVVTRNAISNNYISLLANNTFLKTSGTSDISQVDVVDNKFTIGGLNAKCAEINGPFLASAFARNRISVESDTGASNKLVSIEHAAGHSNDFSGNRLVQTNVAHSAGMVVNATGSMLTNNVFRNATLQVTHRNGDTVPSTAVVGTSTAASDGAALKTHNVIR